MSFKQLQLANWMQPDETVDFFLRVGLSGEIERMLPDDWAGPILAVCLTEQVPADVQQLYQVARGAMLYSYFFYPMFTLASEQLFRVADAATAHRVHELGYPSRRAPFHDRLAWLVRQGVIRRRIKPVGTPFAYCATGRHTHNGRQSSRPAWRWAS